MKKIAVFCGSRYGISNVFKEDAEKFGKELAKRNIALVYGGSSVGIMGTVADSVLEAGGKVIGIMPAFLDKQERSHHQLSEFIVVNSMHERKAKMAELADGFIALPGGTGTLEEFFEIFTWAQIGLHHKPLGLLNIDHYYDPLVDLVNHMADMRFMDEEHRSLALVDADPAGLLNKFNDYCSTTFNL